VDVQTTGEAGGAGPGPDGPGRAADDGWEAERFARQHWPPEVLADEARFRESCQRLLQGIRECCAFRSPYAARFLCRCFEEAHGFVPEGPLRGILADHCAAARGILARAANFPGR
jgi:hypothetical protein